MHTTPEHVTPLRRAAEYAAIHQILVSRSARDIAARVPKHVPSVPAAGIRLLQKIAKQVDAETFGAALAAGELPTVRLTPAEMETARGGDVLYWALYLWGFEAGNAEIDFSSHYA